MQGRCFERFLRWLRVDSTTGEERTFLRMLEEDLVGAGFFVERQCLSGEIFALGEEEPDGGRWNVLARPRSGVVPRVVLCTHVDTVPSWFGPRVEGETVYARGACDTKGVLAAMLAAYEELREEDPVCADEVGFVLVVGEEVDHIGARVAGGLEWDVERVILGEPTRGQIARAQKGVLKIRLETEGRAGHSAFPESGVSAVHRLLEVLERVRCLEWPSDEVAGETTWNVGLLEGGVAANVFAPSASATLLIRLARPVDETLEMLQGCVSDAHARLEILSCNDPQYFDAPEGFAQCIVPFNSDAAWVSSWGPVWLVGPGDIRVAHSVSEHMVWSDVLEGVALYKALIRRVLSCAH